MVEVGLVNATIDDESLVWMAYAGYERSTNEHHLGG